MLRTKNLQDHDFNDVDPWGQLLASVAWAIHSTHHTTLRASPAQLVFGRDMLLDMKFVADHRTLHTYVAVLIFSGLFFQHQWKNEYLVQEYVPVENQLRTE